jgi:hypothetical protein
MMTRKEIIRWWESRRLRYNLWVGVVGLASWVTVWIAGSAAMQSGDDFQSPILMLIGPVFYGIMANVCYSLGWIVDVTWFRGAPRQALYKAGLVFSLVLITLPGLWAVALWLQTVITGHKLDVPF